MTGDLVVIFCSWAFFIEVILTDDFVGVMVRIGAAYSYLNQDNDFDTHNKTSKNIRDKI